MTRSGRNILLLAGACLAGAGAGQWVYQDVSCREAIARFCGKGELLAMVGAVGIYEADRAAHPQQELQTLIVAENLRQASREEAVSNDQLERELDLLRSQFADEKIFAKAMQASALSIDSLRRMMEENLRAGVWVEQQIASGLGVTEEECRQFYETNRVNFQQPQRFRVSHLFLAAHDATPPEDVEVKRKAIQAFAARIKKGESLALLATELSEDEATKPRGGDLGYFSTERMPPEFLAQVEKLRVGETTAPFQTPLGFHIAQLTELLPSRELTFQEARGEITTAIANKKRATIVATLAQQNASAGFLRPSP